MGALKHIDNEYNNNSFLFLIIVITICSILVASLLMTLLIHLKCSSKYHHSFTQCSEKMKEAPTVEMMPMTSTATNPSIHIKVQQALEEKGINPRACEKYLIRKYGKLWVSCNNQRKKPHKCPSSRPGTHHETLIIYRCNLQQMNITHYHYLLQIRTIPLT